METNYSMEEIVSILRHNFYLYYKTFGATDYRTEYAYKEWKETLIGLLEEKRLGRWIC